MSMSSMDWRRCRLDVDDRQEHYRRKTTAALDKSTYSQRPDSLTGDELNSWMRKHNEMATASDSDPLAGSPIGPMPASHDGDSDITISQRFASAMVGSLLTSLIVTPLDVVRVRLQSQDTRTVAQRIVGNATTPATLSGLPPNLGVTACCREVFFISNHAEVCMAGPRIGEIGTLSGMGSGGGAAACAVEETQKRTINSTLDGLRKIARNEGIFTLWRGLSPTLLMTIPANVVYFTGYDWLRHNKSSPIRNKVSDTYAPAVAGAGARLVAVSIVSPIEMFRTRMQASRSSGTIFAETLEGMRGIIATKGLSSLWRGLTLTLWRDVPFSAMYWYGYETIKANIADMRETKRGRLLDVNGPRLRRSRSESLADSSNTLGTAFPAGFISGAIATFVTMPFDVGKTRKQIHTDKLVDVAKPAVAKTAPEDMVMPRFLAHIYRTEGLAGLWTGIIPRTLKVAPACAIMISSFEVCKKLARSRNEKRKDRMG